MSTTISRMGSVLWMALQPSKTLVCWGKAHCSQHSRGKGDPERRIILFLRLFALLSATDPEQAQRRAEIKELHVAPGQAREKLCPKQGIARDAPRTSPTGCTISFLKLAAAIHQVTGWHKHHTRGSAFMWPWSTDLPWSWGKKEENDDFKIFVQLST